MTTTAIPAAALAALRCPATGGPLRREGAAFVSAGGAHYGDEGGRPDLRLRAPVMRTVRFVLGDGAPGDEGAVVRHALPANPRPEVDFGGQPVPRHLRPETLSWIPRARSPDALALDLGCGSACHRGVLERAGFGYVGLDYTHPRAPMLGDAHALPFADGTFELVFSIAVLEHLANPFVAVGEAARVLRPGGAFVGTVAFLEPWHDRSHFHHSHLAVLRVLRHAGLAPMIVAPTPGWTALRAIGRMGLWPRAPRRAVDALVAPLQGLHRLYWRLGGLIREGAAEELRAVTLAGSFFFAARKPG